MLCDYNISLVFSILSYILFSSVFLLYTFILLYIFPFFYLRDFDPAFYPEISIKRG